MTEVLTARPSTVIVFVFMLLACRFVDVAVALPVMEVALKTFAVAVVKFNC